MEGQRERRRRKEKAGKPPAREETPDVTRSTSSPFLPLLPPPSPLSHLRLVLLQQSARACPPRVICHVQDHHTLLLPADERAVRQALNHRQEVLVAMVTCRHHGKGCPVIFLQHLKDDLQLEGSRGAELEKDGT